MQRMLSIKPEQKQRDLLKIVIPKIMEVIYLPPSFSLPCIIQALNYLHFPQVLLESHIKLEASGFLPGSDFPEDESTSDGTV